MDVLHALERFATMIGNAIRERSMANFHSRFQEGGLGKGHTTLSRVNFRQSPFPTVPKTVQIIQMTKGLVSLGTVVLHY